MAKKKTTAMAKTNDIPDLPGIKGVNKKLLGQAVDELNQLYAAKSVETACAIGDYLLGTFFDGELGNFNQWGNKHRTFAELAQMAQGDNSPLHISASGLWYSVRILEQVKALPENIAMALPVTHHRMLIPVKDAKLKERLAKRAVNKGIPSRSFQDEVREAREKEREEADRGFSSGRPPLPNFAKGLKQLVRAIDTATSERITKGSFESFDADQAKKLLNDVDKSLDRLLKLKGSIKKQIESLSE